jgi:hypothetical protein
MVLEIIMNIYKQAYQWFVSEYHIQTMSEAGMSANSGIWAYCL